MQGQCKCGIIDTLFRIEGVSLCGSCFEERKQIRDDEKGITLRKAKRIRQKRELDAGFTAYESVMNILRGIRRDLA